MTTASSLLDQRVAECLRQVLDPEIGLNIVDLGLVVAATRSADEIDVKLTLTSRACPLGELVVGKVREELSTGFPDVARMNVELVWDRKWSQDMITDRGYELLGRARPRTLI